MITRSRQTTRQTQMPAIRERLTNGCPTGACLTRATRVNFYQQSPGAFSLVRKHKDKVRPPSIVNTLSEHSARQSFDVQILDRDQSILVDQRTTKLVVEVAPLVACYNVRPLQQENGLAPAIRPFLATADAALGDSQRGLSVPIPSRVLNGRTVAQGSEVRQADIHSDCARAEWQRSRLDFASEQRIPTSGLTLDGQSLNVSLKWTVNLNANLADFRDAQFISLKDIADQPQRETVIAPRRTEARVARLLPCFHTSKKRLKRKIDALQSRLQRPGVDRGHVLTDRPDRRELKILIEPRNRLPFQLPSITSLLKRCVVKLAANRQLSVERFRLSFRWIDSISESAYYLVSQSVNLTTRFVRRSGSFGVSASFEPLVF